jgi:hypothetical protein
VLVIVPPVTLCCALFWFGVEGGRWAGWGRDGKIMAEESLTAMRTEESLKNTSELKTIIRYNTHQVKSFMADMRTAVDTRHERVAVLKKAVQECFRPSAAPTSLKKARKLGKRQAAAALKATDAARTAFVAELVDDPFACLMAHGPPGSKYYHDEKAGRWRFAVGQGPWESLSWTRRGCGACAKAVLSRQAEMYRLLTGKVHEFSFDLAAWEPPAGE